MYQVMKKQGKRIRAYRLGTRRAALEQLIRDGKIAVLPDGRYEVFSREAVLSGSGHGQIAEHGDWVRIDCDGNPYPAKNDWFQANMKPVGADEYEQRQKALWAWSADQKMCPEIAFLIRKKGLTLNENNPEKYFYAILWGNPEAAAKDAVLVFYSIAYAPDGTILDAEYNFVERDIFLQTYDVIA